MRPGLMLRRTVTGPSADFPQRQSGSLPAEEACRIGMCVSVVQYFLSILDKIF